MWQALGCYIWLQAGPRLSRRPMPDPEENPGSETSGCTLAATPALASIRLLQLYAGAVMTALGSAKELSRRMMAGRPVRVRQATRHLKLRRHGQGQGSQMRCRSAYISR
jgi:hypothetical protein